MQVQMIPREHERTKPDPNVIAIPPLLDDHLIEQAAQLAVREAMIERKLRW